MIDHREKQIEVINKIEEDIKNNIILFSTGVPDDKKFNNSRYFFSNMTLARFNTAITKEFKEKVDELSGEVAIVSYIVDSASLLTCNAVLKKQKLISTWNLQSI